ncbi:hypothetical protein [Pistricoccus aurantiacus]|uniref:hypothetical protein n=1 Tax=Pistricoccus aurantiacus TaxID=1883414 RepID=UPI00362505A9
MAAETKLKKMSLTKHEVLQNSNKKEVERISLYQDVSVGFLPFDLDISRLMKELAKESEARIKSLAQMGKILQPSKVSTLVEGLKNHSRGHSSIVDATMAVDVLEKAWQYEYATQGFYEWLKASSDTNELDMLLTSFIRQSRNQGRILQEAKTQASLLGQWRRDQSTLRRVF